LDRLWRKVHSLIGPGAGAPDPANDGACLLFRMEVSLRYLIKLRERFGDDWGEERLEMLEVLSELGLKGLESPDRQDPALLRTVGRCLQLEWDECIREAGGGE
jgi:hypothetical protein